MQIDMYNMWPTV